MRYFKYRQTYLNTSTSSKTPEKKKTEKKKARSARAPKYTSKWHYLPFSYAIISWNSWNTFEIQTANSIKQLKTLLSILGFTKYFLTSLVSNFKFSSTKFMSAFASFSNGNFEEIGSAQNLGSHFFYQNSVVEISTAPQHHWLKFLHWKWMFV